MLDASVRYPWYMSGRCLDTARDGQWHAVGFMKASMSSGLVWFYRDHRELADHMACAVDCLIGAGSAIVTDGRFGGVVAQPVIDRSNWTSGPLRPC